MPSVRCPECDEKVKIRDGDIIVRCSCGHQLRIDEEDRPARKAKKLLKSGKGSFFQQQKEFLIAAGVMIVAAGFIFIVTVLFPGPGLWFGLVLGTAGSIYGFVRCCQFAIKEGNFISIDYLEFLGGVRIVVIILFCNLYITGYFIMWYVVQIGCAIRKPKVFVPWLVIQGYGPVLLVLCIIAGIIGAGFWGPGGNIAHPRRPPVEFRNLH